MRYFSGALLTLVASSVAIAFIGIPATGASAHVLPGSAAHPVAHPTAPTHPEPAPPARMIPHPAQAYERAAAVLPKSLRASITRDLGMTPAAYLAASSAAQDAADVLDRLARSGVPTRAARLDGTTLQVPVTTAAEAAAVVAAGATPTHGPVDSVDRNSGLTASPASDLEGGEGWGYVTDSAGTGWRCSVGFNGHDLSTGAARFLTAGHCYGSAGAALGNGFLLRQTEAGGATGGAQIGALSASDFTFGNKVDEGLVSLSAGTNPLPAVTTWGGGAGAPTTGIDVTGYTPGVVGAPICKSGSTSGWTCGHILALDEVVTVGDQTVNSIITDACVIPGDSGGAAMIGSQAAGTVSGSTWTDCSQPKSSSLFSVLFPMVSPGGWESAMNSLASSWEPSISIATPAVTSAAVAFTGDALTGSLANGTTRHVISVTFDGSSTPVTAAVSANGSWSVPLAGLTPGQHTYSVVATLGRWSTSPAATGTVSVSVKPAVSRIAGPDRYSVAVAVSQSGFPGTVGTVYVAAGGAFPDALGAAPAAAHAHAPLLLVPGTSIPSAVAAELTRLKPATIVTVGGTGAISAAVFQQLRSFASASVVRIGGTDRFDTSRRLAAYAFPAGSPTAFIANGLNFPDAVSAGAAAGSVSAPIVLVNGPSRTLDAPTVSALDRLGADTFVIAGGTGAISAGIAAQLSARPGATVKRYGGTDRYQTSNLINRAFFATTPTTFLASGLVFPDALSGAARAGAIPAALYTIPQNCIPLYVLAAIQASGTTRVIVLGGTGALGTGVDALKTCP